jgi:hypothetical protein
MAHLFDGFPQNEMPDTNFSDLAGTFPTGGEVTAATFESWDGELQLFPLVDPLAGTAPATNSPCNRDAVIISNPDDSDTIGSLSHQLTAINQRALHAMRSLALPSDVPLKVSSSQVDGAFKDTINLIRVVNDIATISNDGQCESMVSDGLAFLALASHQHLLALFKAICDSINRCLDLATSATEQQQPFLYKDGTLCVAQFVMVLQLLIHLLNRMDRSLFANEAGTTSSGQTTPLTPKSNSVSLRLGCEEPKESQGLPIRAEIIARTIPDRHITLRKWMQELQMRIESSEFF